MPEREQTGEDATSASASDRVFSGYGIASAVLAALSVVATVLGVIIWLGHRSDVDERSYQGRVMRAAVDWTVLLINMNADNVDDNLRRLRDGTAGELNTEFDAAMQPFRQVVQKLQSHNTGWPQSVAIEAVHHDPEPQPGARPPAPGDSMPASIGARTDTVMVVATSASENEGGEPHTVHWNLRLGVSDVDGKLLVSRLESMR